MIFAAVGAEAVVVARLPVPCLLILQIVSLSLMHQSQTVCLIPAIQTLVQTQWAGVPDFCVTKNEYTQNILRKIVVRHPIFDTSLGFHWH